MARVSAVAVVVCCFCGQSLSERDAVRMVIFPPDAEGESQTLYCHRKHLLQHLDRSVPHHPALDDDDESL